MANLIPKTMRHILDGMKMELSEDDSVILSGYRSRDPDVDPEQSPPSLREELVEGGIYTVSQRPVHSHHGINKGHHVLGVENEVKSVTSEMVKVHLLKAGTLEKLVQHLLEFRKLGDASYLAVFLATYRAFTSTKEVLELLLHRLEISQNGELQSEEEEQILKTISSVFSSWLEQYPEDFTADLELPLVQRLARYFQQKLKGSEPERRLQALVKRIRSAPFCTTAEEYDKEDTCSVTGFEAVTSATKEEASNVLAFLADQIAGQLTMLEAELFLKVVPYHCLGSIWSKRDKKGKEHLCPTIRATVRQFNKVTNAVICSCLGNPLLRPQQRARIFEKWIKVAEECRALKNFSSLFAIISALQSNPIHRLKKTWDETSRESVRSYEDLAEIFSEKDNYSQSRELLIKEGTSKFAAPDHNPKKQHKRGKDQKPESIVQGVVPYLGTFLKDFVMLDTAVKDYLENGYINFEKRRKEFEIIAQIHLLQSACKHYSFERDEQFLQWFNSIEMLSEAESYRLSCEVEPPGEPSTPQKNPKPMPLLVITHCADIITSIGGPSHIAWDKPSTPQTPSESAFEFPAQAGPEQKMKPSNLFLTKLTKHSRCPSVSSLDNVATAVLSPVAPSQTTSLSPSTTFLKSHRRAASCGTTFPPDSSPVKQAGSECRIIRVRMEIENGNMYKSILVSSQDKTPAVIQKALEKHNQEKQSSSSYELVQVISDEKELNIPSSANVFYAMNSTSTDFVLRRKGLPITPKLKKNELSATFPKIKSKGMRLAKSLF
ncbi:ral guanine nucleotide dissociation stimulator-like 2 isoform X2 [Protopterus annectens]|uniref:ral guanine nucleotide dissociation stimulator-like 2 isoform X2 n=1 Tax=Protopterus annectens TaxID=7888 RepID=UPI001CFA3B9A|nr:ral guanine nucleotide dissociation stimulator-like 2 isoform X2 [Protopterus annectens]XP_043939473.1 ral guanine nucleotide dissociation stimulator-like 2 isoform X2 [Protopterus annectens]